MIIGTANFTSKEAALRYYRSQHPEMTRAEASRLINGKVERGEITIGAPDFKDYPGAVGMRLNKGGRYEVHVKDL